MTLVASGQSYVLRLALWACVALEDQTGDAFEAVSGRAQMGSVTDLRALLWAMLQARHGDTLRTPDDVGPLIDGAGGLPVALRIVREMLALQAGDQARTMPGPTGPVQAPAWRAFYQEARLLGLDGEAFWQLSLRELRWELETAKLQAERQRDRDVTLAWQVAALVWQKQLPSLESLLTKRDKAPAQNLVTSLYAIGDFYGLKVTTTKQEARPS